MVVSPLQGRYALNPASGAPLYHEIREDLRGRIEDRVIGPGEIRSVLTDR